MLHMTVSLSPYPPIAEGKKNLSMTSGERDREKENHVWHRFFRKTGFSEVPGASVQRTGKKDRARH